MSDVQFVTPLPSNLDVECGICYETLVNPHLTSCCGRHFCRNCLEKISKDKKPCPMCSTTKFTTMLDKSLSRLINGSIVYCTYKPSGCNWQGELRELEKHHLKGERLGECQYVPVQCIYKCSCKVERHLLKKHEDELCLKKPMVNAVELFRHMEDLRKENESLKLAVENLSRLNTMNNQSISSLTQQVDYCVTEMRVLKQALQVFSNGGDLRIPNLESLVTQFETTPPPVPPPSEICVISTPATESCLRVVPYEFKFDNYDRRFANSEMWMSRPFYTHTGGYKMCIRVSPNGTGNGETTHVSVHIYLMRGEFDDLLSWPFKGSLTIRMLNQIGDECHHEQTTTFSDKTPIQYGSRVTKKERSAQGWGKSQFISHAELQYDSGREVQYLKDDCLIFRIVAVNFQIT